MSTIKEILAVGLFRKLAAVEMPPVSRPQDEAPVDTETLLRVLRQLRRERGKPQGLGLGRDGVFRDGPRPKLAEGESLGPSQDTQAVGQAQAAAQKPKTLQELMGTPDVQKWFRGSVGGLARRSQIPYALLQPGQEPQTNMQHEELRAILQQILAAKAEAAPVS